MNVSQISNQCSNHLLCDDKYCNKTHFRCFIGLCIKQESCQDTQCKLLHLNTKSLRQEQNIFSINGIYRFNICKNHPCIEQLSKSCPFLHPKWAKKYCYNYFMDDCQDNTHQNHKEWNDIRKEVYAECQQKLQMKCSPEFNLEDEVNFFKLKNICYKNLKGICEKKNDECIYRHIFWEDLNQVNYLKSETFKSCIEQNNEDNYKSLKQYHSQSVLINDQELKRLKQAFIVQNLVDLIFIMDFTNSMQDWIDMCKSSIKGIIESFQRNLSKRTLRVGMVGYRDVHDQQPLTYHNLTTNVDELIAFIAKQKAYGGGDDAEDVCLGIKKAMDLNISKNPNSTLITILFADAPCHGKQYHNGICDYQAYSVPDNTLENLMLSYFNLKQQNFFTCVHITDKTKKMYNIMQQKFEGLIISQPSQQQNFEDLVKFTLQESLNATRIQKYDQFQVKFQRLNHQGESVIEQFELNQSSYVIDDQFEIFYFYDHSNNQKMNVKISKQVIEIINKKQQPSQEIIIQLEEEAEKNYKSQIEAVKLCQNFRKKTKNIKGACPIFISAPILYQLKDDAKFYGLSKIYGETCFDIDEESQECLSNQFINEIPDYYDINLQAFSHYVFEETQWKFTYIEFKGQRNLLTQPTIINIHDTEITDFVNYHKECNFICQELKLPVMFRVGKISLQQQIIQKEVDQIDIFCQNCGAQAIIANIDYQNNDRELCKECLEDQTRLEDIFCKCCKEIFQISVKQKITSKEVINKCNNCLYNCNVQKNQQCYYCKMKCPQNLKTIPILENQIIICEKGLKYIKQLQCQNCGEIYNFKKLIDKEFFLNQTYFCSKCQ